MLIMPLDFNFDTVLVTSIDKLLKRNRITKVSSLDIVLEDFEDESSASSMVVRTVAEALKSSKLRAIEPSQVSPTGAQ